MMQNVKDKFNKHKVAFMAVLAVMMAPGLTYAEEGNEIDEGLLETLIGVVTDVIEIFTEPPLVWFVVLGLVAGGIGIVRRLIPKKGAK